MAPAEERKVATVLFADLVGSTELGEQDPERTRAVLDRFYDAMAAEIEAAAGRVEKFAGDAVMAAFGAPARYEDHAERALHAALAMQRRLRALRRRLQLRIGVNTGEVVVGRAARRQLVRHRRRRERRRAARAGGGARRDPGRASGRSPPRAAPSSSTSR